MSTPLTRTRNSSSNSSGPVEPSGALRVLLFLLCAGPWHAPGNATLFPTGTEALAQSPALKAQPSASPMASGTATRTPFRREQRIKLLGAVKPGAPAFLNVALLERDFPRLYSFKAPKWQAEPPQEFTGVPMADIVAKYADAGVTRVLVVATNQYAEFVDAEDWNKHGAVLAFRSNGKPIPTRNRGTFRIVFDHKGSAVSELAALGYKWVWQVESMEFLKHVPPKK